MSTLVVGGTGGLGTAVTAALRASGRTVVTLARNGADLIGDVTQPHLGLDADALADVTVDEIVWAPGAVDWQIGPRAAIALHQDGTRHLVEFARSLTVAPRIAYVSSILAVGRAEGPVTSDFLFGDQRFRNWYELGKHRGEAEARDAQSDLDLRILRFGPLIGAMSSSPSPGGIEAAVPFLCQGWPVHLEQRGDFPSYAASIRDAADVIVASLDRTDFPRASTWIDPAEPSLRSVLEGLCARRGVTPKIVDLPVLGRLTKLVRTERFGLPPELLAYRCPLPELDLSAEREFLDQSGLELMATPTARYLHPTGVPTHKELEVAQ